MPATSLQEFRASGGKAGPRACLIAYARTGSSMLVSLLAAQRGTVFVGEPFHPAAVYLPPRFGGAEPATLRADRDADPLGFLAWLAEQAGPRVFGFKLLAGHAPPVRAHVICDPAWRILLLRRDNLLAVHASKLVAAARGDWRSVPRDAPPPRVRFEEARFLEHCRLYERHYATVEAELASAAKPALRLSYLDLADAGRILAAARHCGVPHPAVPPPRTVRQGDPDIRSRFENPEDVDATLRAIGREDWAVEPFPAPAAAGLPA